MISNISRQNIQNRTAFGSLQTNGNFSANAIKSVVNPVVELSHSIFRGREVHIDLSERRSFEGEFFMDLYPLGKEKRNIFGTTPKIRYIISEEDKPENIAERPNVLKKLLEHWDQKMDVAKRRCKLNATDEQVLKSIVPEKNAMWTDIHTNNTQYPENR